MSKPNLSNKKCRNCNTGFSPWKKTQKFCSRECYYDHGNRKLREKESWWINTKGYVEGRVWVDDNTQVRVLQHRWKMEKHLGRELKPWEDVHHKDEDKTNNDISNLEVIDHGEHSTITNNRRDYNTGYEMDLSDEERERRSRILSEWHKKQALKKAGVEL